MASLVLIAALVSFLGILEIGYAIVVLGSRRSRSLRIRRESSEDDLGHHYPDHSFDYLPWSSSTRLRRYPWGVLFSLGGLISATLIVYCGLVIAIGIMLFSK